MYSMKDRLIHAFESLAQAEAAKRQAFKAVMYKRAAAAFRRHDGDIKTLDDANSVLRGVFKDPKKMSAKVKEMFETGDIAAVQKIRNDPDAAAIRVLSSIPHIGPVKARQLASSGILSVADLKRRGGEAKLTRAQELGVKYYNRLIDPKTLDARRIPREEIEAFDVLLARHAKGLDLRHVISGSYRRGAGSSGDIDVLLTGDKGGFSRLVKALEDGGVLKDHFSSGRTKWMGIGVIQSLPRRIDLMYVPAEEYPFASLYFTGSKEFNEAFRGHARRQGFTLNEHGIKRLDGTPIRKGIDTEKDVFDLLGVRYHAPEQRVAGAFEMPRVENRGASLKDRVACMKTGAEAVRAAALARGLAATGTKKELCYGLFPDAAQRGAFDVSKGVLLAETYRGTDPAGYYASEKFDGIRAVWDGKRLLSRTDKPIAAPKWFLKWLPANVPLDGELYIGRGMFEKTASVVSKKVPDDDEWRDVRYYIFDLPHSPLPFAERYRLLRDVVRDACKATSQAACPLTVPVHTLISSKGELDAMFANIVSKGGEGVMLRRADSVYVQKRSKDLLKVKPTDDAEARITGMVEGKGKDSGSMGALQVTLVKDPSVAFRIGTGFTAAQRRDMWAARSRYVGKVVTFGYKGLTSRGVPRHPAFVRVRANANM